MNDSHLTIALAGNPNSGKTTIFNALTSQRRHVGNYPGVTVAKREGTAEHGGETIRVVDLPGTYSLTAYSIDEIVARNFVLDENPDVVVDIVDSSNLERNLYLATQFLELGVPLVLAFNKSDLARARGYNINVKKLSGLLGVPIVRTVGHKGRGIDHLLSAAVELSRDGAAVARQRRPRYGSEVEPHVQQLSARIERARGPGTRCRWLALKLLENDTDVAERIAGLRPDDAAEILAEADRLRGHIEGIGGDSAEILFADRRYGFISGACTESVTQTVEARHERSDRIDAMLTNRYLGLPLFAVMMYVVFQATFAIGNPLVDMLDGWKGRLADAVRSLAPQGDSLLVSLLADGVIEGAGAVLAFVPLVALLYMAIAILEDSGYMARAAFVLDKLMHRVGLHGKSFIPMLIGFGCTVPAIMATRILESRRGRLTTILILPLMSCGARLPVYVLMLGAFFPARVIFGIIPTGADAQNNPTYLLAVTNQALLLFGIYMTGILLAVAAAKLLRCTIFRGEATPFVMELPPYRMPALRGLLVHTWERTWMYVRKAGTIILAIVMILWALQTWPRLPTPQRQAAADRARSEGANVEYAVHQARLVHSGVGRIGHVLAPALKPCGFDWKISTALLGSFAAKEVFVGQMGVIHAVGEAADETSTTLRQRLAAAYTPLQGLCMMLFILIASPCMATVAMTVHETGSWKWAALQWCGLTVMAWLVTTAVYQIGTLAGF